jgi:hypothetical protein
VRKAEIATASDCIQAFINVSGKYFHDVGYGFNAEVSRDSVARVRGAEPYAIAAAYVTQNEEINEANTHHGRLQDMLKSFAEDIDITALFLWNMLRLEYDGILITLSSTISPAASSTDNHRCSSTPVRPVEALSKSIKLLTCGVMFGGGVTFGRLMVTLASVFVAVMRRSRSRAGVLVLLPLTSAVL